jgi:hypothetical protein
VNHPTPHAIESPVGVAEQSQPARRLATILIHAGQELQDAATEADAGYMWEQARAIASRILASCPVD